jgi:hypothetical protein
MRIRRRRESTGKKILEFKNRELVGRFFIKRMGSNKTKEKRI